MGRIAGLVGALCMVALHVSAVNAQDDNARDEIVRPVHLLAVGADDVGPTRQFFGHVVARQTVDLAFQVSGQIVRLPAAEGEVFIEGSLIAQLDLEPFELQHQQAELQFDRAERQLDRMNQLGDSISDVSREDAETELNLARVSLRNAALSLENATLSAPFDGLVASRNVANFTTVSQGTPVVRLHDMSELRIEIDVPEVVFQRAGENADVTFTARFPSGAALYPLEVREFNAEASSIGQTFRLTLALSQPEGLTVLPGSSATVIATLNTDATVLTVPSTAVRVANDGATSVMRFVPGDGDTGRVEEIPVTVEPDHNGDIVVVAGLAPGDVIVRTGAHALRDGDDVRRFNGYPN